MAEKIHSHQWTANSLGPIEEWPHPLHTVVEIMLNSCLPMFTLWSPRQIMLYNDKYAELLAERHPNALGKSFFDVWPEFKNKLKPVIKDAFAGKPTQTNDIHQVMYHKGLPQEAFFNFSFTPIGEGNGRINGVLCSGTETTESVLLRGRQSAILDLSHQLDKATSPEEAVELAAKCIDNYSNHIPFTLFYKIEPSGNLANLIASNGINKGSILYQDTVDLDKKNGQWPIKEVLGTNKIERVDKLKKKFGSFKCGPYEENPDTALLLPVKNTGKKEPEFVMIAGTSALLPLDKAYEDFFKQVCLTLHFAIERCKAEASFIRSEKRYHSIVNNPTIGIAQINSEDRITYVNDRFCQITGKLPEQLINQRTIDLIHPVDYREILSHRTELFAKGKSFEIERRLIKADGEPVWLFNSISPISDERGEVIAASVASIDISKQKQIEETLRQNESRLSAIFSKASVGISEISTDGKVIIVNEEICRMLGRSKEEMLSSNLADVTHEEDLPKSLKAVENLLKTGKQASLEKRYIHSDGHEIYANSTLTLLKESQFHDKSILAVTVDISKTKRQERNTRFIADINATLATLSNLNEIMQATAEKISRHFGVASVSFAEIDDTGDYLTTIYEKNKAGIKSVIGTHRLSHFMSEAYLKNLKAGQIMAIEDIETDPLTASMAEAYKPYNVKSQVHSPYLRDGKWRFLLSILCPSPYSWEKDEIELIHDLTARIYLRLDRAHAENALQKNETRLKRILDIPTVAVIFFNKEGILIDANNAFLQLTGFSKEDIQEKQLNWKDLTPPEFRDISKQQMEILKETGKIEPYEKEYYRKDGSRIWMLFAGAEIGDEIQVEFCVDITERKKAEKKLLESENRYKTLFNSMDEGFCIIEMLFDDSGKAIDYRFIETNPAFYKQTGLTKATGKTMKELVPELEEHWFEIYGAIARTGQPARFVNTAKALMNGWFEVYAFPYGGVDSNKIGVIFNNITRRIENEEALRRSEEHLQLIMESAKDYAIFTSDKKGVITSWNAGAENLFGYKHNEIIGKGSDLLFLPQDRETVPEKEMDVAVLTGNAQNERWHLRKDGSRFWGSGLTMPLKNRNSDLRGYLKIMRDNTQQRKIQKELQEARQREIELIKAENNRKDEFISIASHELKTPLTSLQAYIQLMIENADQMDHQTIHTFISKIDKSAQRISNLIKELLDANRIKSGKIEYNFDHFDFKHMVEESLEMARHYTTHHEIKLTEKITEPVYGDRERLQQVVNNLLSNAIKYAPGGGEIKVNISTNNGEVKLSVTDPGIGIPEDQLDTIFQSYSRVDTGLLISGMGLGLYISEEIIRRHNGRIWVESALDRGSTFHFTIPIRPS